MMLQSTLRDVHRPGLASPTALSAFCLAVSSPAGVVTSTATEIKPGGELPLGALNTDTTGWD
ncbi:hypothetical protein [Streptomyces sp. NPDC001880]